MSGGTAIVATTTDYVLAHVWRDVLSEAGIPAQILGEGMSSVYPGIPGIAGVRLMVREEDVLRAREALARAELGAQERDGADEPPGADDSDA
jgi:hypothetical protein